MASNELISVEALMRKMRQLDTRIEANKAQIKRDRHSKAGLNKIIALVQQIQPETATVSNVTPIKPLKKCPTCGEQFTQSGLGVHIRMKHQGGASKAHKASQASRKRAARG